MLTRRLLCLNTWLLVSAQLGAMAQTGELRQRFELTSEAVLLDVVVRDKKGRIITDLTREDFHVFENGEEREILSVRFIGGDQPEEDHESDEPLALRSKYMTSTPVSVLSHSHLVSLVFDRLDNETRRYSREAVDDLLKLDLPRDTYFGVFTIDKRLRALSLYTNDLEEARAAVDLATSGRFETIRSQSAQLHSEVTDSAKRVNETMRASSPGVAVDAAQRGTPNDTGGPATPKELTELTLLINILENALSAEGMVQGHDVMDAMHALVSAQKQLPGRKTVVFFSQGLYIPDPITYRFQNLISQSNLANVSIYSVDTRGVTSQSQNRMGAETLNRAAALNTSQTFGGGSGAISAAEVRSMETAADSIRMNVQETLDDLSRSTGGFLIANTNNPSEAMERLIGELQQYYELAFVPAPSDLDSGYRKITVNVDRPSVAVQSRDGFFPSPPTAGGPVRSYEVPLLESLATSPRPREFPISSRTFHFEPGVDGIEHIVAAAVPFNSIQFREDQEKNRYTSRLSILALVRTFGGEIVFKKSRDFDLEGPLSELEELKKQGEVALIEGFTVQHGRYHVEVAAHDHISGKSSTTRKVLMVMKPKSEISISSLLTVAALEPLTRVDKLLHSPLKYADHMVIPRIGSTVKEIEESDLAIYCVVYTPKDKAVKAELTVAVLKDGKVLFKGSPTLVDADGKRLASLFTIPAVGLSGGTYRIRASVRYGQSFAQASEVFTVADEN